MRILYFTSILLLFGCVGPIHIYERTEMIHEKTKVTLDKKKEAIRVQNRIAKYCSEPERKGNTLYLTDEQLQCSKNEKHGFIKEKYREQINKQLVK